MTAASIRLAVLAVAGWLPLFAHAGSDFRSAAPAGLREEVVLAGTVINGDRLHLVRFEDRRPVARLLEETRDIWSHRPAPIHSTRHDGWWTLTQIAGGALDIFEVRVATSGTGSQGRRMRWRKGDDGLEEAAAWLQDALPAGSRIVKRISHQDGGRQMTTLVAVTARLADSVSSEFAAALNRNGFRSALRSARSLERQGRVLFLARGSEDIAVTISEHEGERAIVVHWGRAVQ